jgi:hypothetical protein
MSGGEVLLLKVCLKCLKSQEFRPKTGQPSIYRDTLSNRAVGQKSRAPDAPTHRHRKHSAVSGYQISPRVLHVQSSAVVSTNSGRSSAFHRTHHTWCPMWSSKLPEFGNVHRTRPTQHHRTRHHVLCSPALLPRATSAGTGR